MRVLQLISSSGFFGAENVLYELSKGLKASGIDNTIGVIKNLYNPHTELVTHAIKASLQYQIFECRNKVDAATFFEIMRYAKRFQIDLFHTHGYKANIYAFLITRILKKSVIATCHNWNDSDIRSRIYYFFDKALLKKFTKTIAVSENVRNELLRSGVNDTQIAIIPNGVDINRFQGAKSDLRDELNIPQDATIIGSVSRLTSEKGLPYLLRTAKSVLNNHNTLFFLIVGDGPLLHELKKSAADLGLQERVIFAGQRDDMPEVYSTLDILILPSLVEGLPMTILEAMASKKPVIATKVGEIPKVIENGRTGLLVKPGSGSELARAITKLLRSESLSKFLAENGFETVKGRYSSKRMTESYIEVYRSLIRK